MVDFSSGGACLAEVYKIKAGAQIVMRLPQHTVSAEVMWVINNRCGVKFTKALTDDQIRAIKDGPIPRKRKSARNAGAAVSQGQNVQKDHCARAPAPDEEQGAPHLLPLEPLDGDTQALSGQCRGEL